MITRCILTVAPILYTTLTYLRGSFLRECGKHGIDLHGPSTGFQALPVISQLFDCEVRILEPKQFLHLVATWPDPESFEARMPARLPFETLLPNTAFLLKQFCPTLPHWKQFCTTLPHFEACLFKPVSF